jgi:hypothetical protein
MLRKVLGSLDTRKVWLMKNVLATLIPSAMALVVVAACVDDSTEPASASDKERKTACDALRAASGTAKLVQAGPALDNPSAIDASGAPRRVMLKGEVDDKNGYLEVNLDDASFLLLVGPSVPVDIMDSLGREMLMSEQESNPSWCDAAGQSRLWRAKQGQRSILALGPTRQSQVGLVLLRVGESGN